MPSDYLIKCNGVSKKFCKSLKRSLFYAATDILNEINPFCQRDNFSEPALRKNEFWAVKDISFELKRGECLGLIGHNGAGKSTLLKILNGLIPPDQGEVHMRGRVGALIELGAGFNPILTGRENIYNQGAVLGLSKKEIATKFHEIVDFAEMAEFIDMPVQNYSSGMKVRLGFAVVAQMEPDVLLVDEVLAVGDIGFQIKCLNKVGEIMPETAIIFVSHSMPMVARICNQTVLLESGLNRLYTRDVADGIQSYLTCFNGPKSMELGDGTATLETINISQQCMEENISVSEDIPFNNGNTLIIDMVFIISESRDERAMCIVKIFDQQFRECINCFSHDASNATYAVKKSRLSLRVKLPSLFLNRGPHYIAIALEGIKTRTVYSYAANNVSFNVNAKIQGWATSIFPGEWTQTK